MTGCARVDTQAAERGGDLLDRMRAQGRVRLGIAGEIPYAYVDSQGKLTGQAPAIAKVIFGNLGIETMEPVPTEFGSLIPGLKSLQFDVVSAGMWISPDRCEQVIFSDPDYVAKDAFIVAKGNPKELHTYEDLTKPGVRFATGNGWFQADYATGNGYKRSRIQFYADQVAGLDAVRQGRADAFAGTSPTIVKAVENAPGVEASEPFIPEVDGEEQIGAGGFAFRPIETNLRDAFNEELHKLKDSGRLLEIVEPFGFTADDMTDLTAKELCSP
ncbi:ectoine/hydroxyectoine ABC transporter substrate-binding protein EhuB [Streptomyces gobiensis]|nr:ectoine/hydroxyectoine ABC transporter substrate-binding protein EhuB [Streptomyces gobiensis]UGY91584.1 ectoine/hydroxyectoine ABC transporter substrate-binding protein EhuB [Streptomyces gobiensis]